MGRIVNVEHLVCTSALVLSALLVSFILSSMAASVERSGERSGGIDGQEDAFMRAVTSRYR